MATEEISMGAKRRRATRRARRVARRRAGRSAAMTAVVAALLIVGLGSTPASTVARRLGGALRVGDTARAALFRAGQPLTRPGRSFRYCVGGPSATSAWVASVFKSAGKVALIASTATGTKAGGVGLGAAAARLRKHGATRLASGLWEGRKLSGGARYVYSVRGGKVRSVALAGAGELHSVSRLRADLRAAGMPA
jgi:hypothetical protein